MTDTELYSTIASIVGVWLSAVVSLSVAIFTYIIIQNINFFKLLRDEKIKFSSSIIDKDIYFSGSQSSDKEALRKSNERALIRSNEKLKNIESICKQSEDKIKENLCENISTIWNNIEIFINCYPSLYRLGNFLFTKELLNVDDGYKSWLKDRNLRIDYNLKENTFWKLDIYLKYIEQNELATSDTQPTILKIKHVINKLRAIDSSINNIDMLNRDYESIDAIFIIIKSKLTLVVMSGTLFFGVLIPLYMLLPTQFINKIPEYWVIIGIFAGLSVCGYGTYHIMKQIFNSFIKK